MPFCSPDKITVSPDRFRIVAINDPAVIEMAESIKEIGQLQAILVNNEDEKDLIDGLNRLMACKRLNKDVWYLTEAEGKLVLNNPLLRRVAEYQANFIRKDFTPMEKSRAIAEIDRLMREIYGSKKAGGGIGDGWTQEDTAKKLGHKSHRVVSEAVAINKAVETGIVPGIEKAATMQEASKMVKDAIRLKASELLAERNAKYGIATEIGNPKDYFSERVILGDCLEKMKELSASICSLFITDPPFAINFDNTMANRPYSIVSKVQGVYEDDKDTILSLIESLIPEMARVGKPSCQVIMFCGIQFWHIIRDWFKEAGFTVHKKPLIWVKASTNPFKMIGGRTSNPACLPGSSYEAMIYAYRGSATLAKQGLPDVFVHQTLSSNEKCHIAQKPLPLLEEIISRFYHPGTNPLLIDPFVGSGSTLTAARRVGIKQFFGYELDHKNRDRAIAEMTNQYMKDQEGLTPSTTMDNEEFE